MAINATLLITALLVIITPNAIFYLCEEGL
jgi:hypothetical protein